jgi:hypothetical protein
MKRKPATKTQNALSNDSLSGIMLEMGTVCGIVFCLSILYSLTAVLPTSFLVNNNYLSPNLNHLK